ncbi:MAG TPA: PQQ-binding-like beta-propeller repeat protein [Pirellulales bacterium]|jgi:outer membrane protein assembly factor BamB|nr:PQQ-binding-like beta-propeller repeat protein [Pirellulales bacterium]
MGRGVFWTLIFAFVTSGALVQAADWPQWRGPHRNGISAETGLLHEWPTAGPKLVWQVKDVGDGFSTPSVVGDSLYLLSNKGTEEESVQARAVADGKRLWSTPIGKVGPNKGPQYPGARSTPTVDGERLYVLGSAGDLACLDIKSGNIAWQKNLIKDFGGEPGMWAYAESPLIDGDKLICTPGGKESTVVALDKSNGNVIWKSGLESADQAAYASPIEITVGGVKQYVLFLQKGLVGLDTKTGKLLWRYDKTAQGSMANIPTPVAFEGFVYSAAGRTGGGLVQLTAKQGDFKAEQVYFSPKLPTSIGGAVHVGDYLYGTSSGGLLCVDFKTGDVKWQERGVGAASICFADGDLYLHGEKGEVALVEASPEAYHEKGRFTPPDSPDRGKAQAWTYPVVANGRLYIRDLGVLWSFDIKAKK